MPEVTFHIGQNPGQVIIHIIGSDGEPIDSKTVSKLVSILNVSFIAVVGQVAKAITEEN